MPIKKHYHSIRIYYIHLLPQQLKRTPAPPVEFPSQLVAQRVRRIHPTYLLEFDDGETMEVDQPTKVPVRPERPGGLSWDSDILWVCCWGHLWLLVTMPSWNSKGKRGFIELNPLKLFCLFMWKFILGDLVCDTFGRVFIPCPSCEASFFFIGAFRDPGGLIFGNPWNLV